MQRSRRSTPYPLTWEVPTAAVFALVLVLVLGLQAGRSISNLLAGGSWRFVNRADLFVTVPGLLRGDAAAGLTSVAEPANPQLLWACMATTCVLLLALACWLTKVALDRWGPGRLQGMATAADAENLLGRSRLRRHAQVIRPDLYGRARGARR